MRREYEHGRALLIPKIEAVAPPLVLFVFKSATVAVLGPINGNGFIEGVKLGGAQVFVMPGPYASRGEVEQRLDELRRFWRDLT